jgi:hypothetical protein
VIGLLLRLYPAAWRRRYGEEFAALLEERLFGPFDVADVVLGAIDAHLHLRGLRASPAQHKGLSMSLRIGGLAAMIGAVVWPVGWAMSAPLLILAGTAGLLVGLIGLSAFQSRRHPVLVWAALALPAIGNVISIVGVAAMALVGDRPIAGGFTPWSIWMVGLVAMVGGSALFAFVTYRTAALARWAGISLAAGSIGLLLSLAAAIWLEAGGRAQLYLFVGLGAFVAGWFGLGLDALRRSRPLAGVAPA